MATEPRSQAQTEITQPNNSRSLRALALLLIFIGIIGALSVFLLFGWILGLVFTLAYFTLASVFFLTAYNRQKNKEILTEPGITPTPLLKVRTDTPESKISTPKAREEKKEAPTEPKLASILSSETQKETDKEEKKEDKSSRAKIIKYELQTKFKIAKELLDDPLWTQFDPDWETVLKSAKEIHNMNLQHLVFLAGLKDKEVILKKWSPFCWDASLMTPLQIAAHRGDIDLIELLHGQLFNLDIRQIDKDGLNLLFYAGRAGNMEVVKYLVTTHGLNPKQLNKHGENLLFYAGRAGNVKVVEYLVATHGLDPKQLSHKSSTLLHCAAFSGDHTAVLSLYHKYYSPEDMRHLKNQGGTTVLHCAAMSGEAKVVEVLCEKFGFDPKQTDDNGNTLLWYAMQTDNVEIIVTFGKKFGWYPNRSDIYSHRFSLFSHAAIICSIATVEGLIEECEIDIWEYASSFQEKMLAYNYKNPNNKNLNEKLNKYAQLVHLGLPPKAHLPYPQKSITKKELDQIHLDYLFYNTIIISEHTLLQKLPKVLVKLVYEYTAPRLNEQKEVTEFLRQIEAFNEKIFAPLIPFAEQHTYFSDTREKQKKEAKKLLRALRPSSTSSLFFIQKKMGEIEKRKLPESKEVPSALDKVKENLAIFTAS